jgi:hypothetical protein
VKLTSGMMNLTETPLEDRPVLEEHAVVEHRGLLGGKKIETNAGKLERTTYLMACDFCGKYPLENFVLCRTCASKLCSTCAVKVDGRPYCRTHLNDALGGRGLSRPAYLILNCINSQVQSVSKIAEICRLDKDDVKNSLAVLVESKYITVSGVLSFLSRKITAEGVRVLSVYSKVFDADEDVAEVKSRLKEEVNDGT